MKYLLINPIWGGVFSAKGDRFNRSWPPLDLLNCAALLEKEYIEVYLNGARTNLIEIEQIAHITANFSKCFINSSPIDRWQCPNIDINPFLKLINSLPKFAWTPPIPVSTARNPFKVDNTG